MTLVVSIVKMKNWGRENLIINLKSVSEKKLKKDLFVDDTQESERNSTG
jgi:hypothetical protein